MLALVSTGVILLQTCSSVSGHNKLRVIVESYCYRVKCSCIIFNTAVVKGHKLTSINVTVHFQCEKHDLFSACIWR